MFVLSKKKEFVNNFCIKKQNKTKTVSHQSYESFTALSVQSDQRAPPNHESRGLVTTQEATLITLAASCSWLSTASLGWTAAVLKHSNIQMNVNSQTLKVEYDL